MKLRFLSYLLSLNVILILAISVMSEKNPPKRVQLDLESLPEPFLNDHLPSREFDNDNKNETCYSLMGCYEKIPVFALPSNPMDLRTVFTIKYKDLKSEILVENCINCLAGKPEECEKYPFDLQQLKDSPFKPDRRTIVIIGGYRSKTKDNWESRVADLWPQLEPTNVILVGWEEGSNTVYYPNAAANSRPVARQITVLIYYLAKLNGGVDLFEEAFTEKFHLVGHSLGAHIAGFVGSDLAGTLGRITGLDPAGPSFDSIADKYRIDKSDAQFVDIMHTNAGSKLLSLKTQYGSNKDAGHINLWVNDGQHQPGCTTEIFGCSHRLAGQYYESFLKDVLAMRTQLGYNYKPMYRLRAYKGETFNEFHDGMALAKYCPIASMEDNDLSYEDLDLCSIPVDFLAWPTDYRNELRMTHGLDFNDSAPPNRFYFYTQAAAALKLDKLEQLDHQMIRVRVTKADGPASREVDKSGILPAEGCSVGVKISMANGVDTSTKINNYKLIDLEDHREVVFPFLSPNLATKYEIAQLDSQDFYVKRDKRNDKEFLSEENLGLLLRAIDQVFPSSVALNGFATDEKKRRGVLETIKSWFKGKQDEDESEANDKTITSNGTDCKLPIESFVVQPLRKFRRHLSAFYKRNCPDHDQPTPEVKIVLLGEKEPSPKRLLFDESSTGCQANGLELTLDTVIIGPLLNAGRDDEIEDGILDQSSWANTRDLTLTEGGTNTKRHVTTGSAKHWLKMTALLIFILSIVILVSVLEMRKLKQEQLDRRNLMMATSANANYSDAC